MCSSELDRSHLISGLYNILADKLTEDEYDLGYRDVALATARATLNDYSSELLTKLRESALAKDTHYLMMATVGANESKVETFITITDEYFYLFDGRLHNVCQMDVAVESLSLYSSLLGEDQTNYCAKAIALTGVVTTIQHVLSETENEYVQGNGRFLSYFASHEYFMNERLVRITNDALVDLILNRSEDWERIADIVTKRETDDAEIIKYLLESEGSGTLTEGKL